MNIRYIAETEVLTDKLFGHNNTGDSALVENLYKQHPDCHTKFCTAYKKNSYAISTQRVSAMPGNVITGLRYRLENKVIYMDIQQGKYMDILSVDPAVPVFWTKTPESNEIAYLGAKLKKIELGDFSLPENGILTSIQMKKTTFRGGLIKFITNGFNPLDNKTVTFMNSELELNEIKLEHADDPKYVNDTKNLISKPLGADKRYSVSFQPSDFEKDFGQSTVPLLDTRECVSYPPSPLNGIRLYHEAAAGSGGLIAISLIQPDMSNLLDFKQIEQATDTLFKLD
ncbi:uncharacterized protein LOC129908739 [Episyrphus balteatus]|uniref:uncharacterized protein LOC129908739 n=1 Tax=Episyrphus balteatus TaxID=286459 RepID=UPI002484EC79|nr:uncharacterized protein LOC129908739 [Episyrphus balteatus]